MRWACHKTIQRLRHTYVLPYAEMDFSNSPDGDQKARLDSSLVTFPRPDIMFNCFLLRAWYRNDDSQENLILRHIVLSPSDAVSKLCPPLRRTRAAMRPHLIANLHVASMQLHGTGRGGGGEVYS